jgi:hypothetical protein
MKDYASILALIRSDRQEIPKYYLWGNRLNPSYSKVRPFILDSFCHFFLWRSPFDECSLTYRFLASLVLFKFIFSPICWWIFSSYKEFEMLGFFRESTSWIILFILFMRKLFVDQLMDGKFAWIVVRLLMCNYLLISFLIISRIFYSWNSYRPLQVWFAFFKDCHEGWFLLSKNNY